MASLRAASDLSSIFVQKDFTAKTNAASSSDSISEPRSGSDSMMTESSGSPGSNSASAAALGGVTLYSLAKALSVKGKPKKKKVVIQVVEEVEAPGTWQP